MRIIRALRAQDIAGAPVEPITLIIEEPIPSMKTLVAQDAIQQANAEIVADALCSSLPGGTLNRLTAELLLRAAGSLVVLRPALKDE